MIDVFVSGFLDALAAYRTRCADQIRGLGDLEKHEGLDASERDAIVAVRRTRASAVDQIDAILRLAATLLDLVAAFIASSSYPALDPVPAPPSLLRDIDREIAELQLARAQFAPEPEATAAASTLTATELDGTPIRPTS